MRGLKIIVPVALCLVFFIILLARVSQDELTPPGLVRTTAQPTNGFRSVHYPWGDAVPFQNGKVWLWAVSASTNAGVHTYLYDLDGQKVLFELTNGWAVFSNYEQSRLLCRGHDVSQGRLKHNIAGWLERISNGKLSFKLNHAEEFWIVDLRDNSARRVGELWQVSGHGSRWNPSPGFRYGYNVPSAAKHWTFALCDLESMSMTTLKVRGELKGWWNNQNIIIEKAVNSFVLFNVATRKTSSLFSAPMVEQFIRQAGLTNSPGGVEIVPTWNGSAYDIYLAPRFAFHKNAEGFLLRVDRASRTLKLHHRNFKFEHLGRINAEGTHYLYSGETGPPGRGGNGAVLLRDLGNNTNHTLVEPDHAGRYALPRFYDKGVIYLRNRVLWRVDLDGSNNMPLFPQEQPAY